MFKSKTILNIASWSLLSLFGAIWLNSVLFLHVHVLSNQQIVIHVHPYKKSDSAPFQNHDHSEGEMFLLEVIANVLYDSPDEIDFSAEAPQYVDLPYPVVSSDAVIGLFLTQTSPRAPPTV